MALPPSQRFRTLPGCTPPHTLLLLLRRQQQPHHHSSTHARLSPFRARAPHNKNTCRFRRSLATLTAPLPPLPPLLSNLNVLAHRVFFSANHPLPTLPTYPLYPLFFCCATYSTTCCALPDTRALCDLNPAARRLCEHNNQTPPTHTTTCACVHARRNKNTWTQKHKNNTLDITEEARENRMMPPQRRQRETRLFVCALVNFFRGSCLLVGWRLKQSGNVTAAQSREMLPACPPRERAARGAAGRRRACILSPVLVALAWAAAWAPRTSSRRC